MNAIASNVVSNRADCTETIEDGEGSHATALIASPSFGLLRIPPDMQQEILSLLGAQDITCLASVSVSMRMSLLRHPVLLAFSRMGATKHYATLIMGLEAIQSTPLRFRAPLMREYASRMVRIEDGDGTLPWRYYVWLCEGQLRADAAPSTKFLGLRDLCLVQQIATLRIFGRPRQDLDQIHSWEADLDVLPSPYRASLVDTLLGLGSKMSHYERNLFALAGFGSEGDKRSSVQFIAVMAALQLFDVEARDVCHHFMTRFAVGAEQRTARFEPVVALALATCFLQRGGDVEEILGRWGMNHDTLLQALYHALLQKVMETMRNAHFCDMTPRQITSSGQGQAIEFVLGMPSDATKDLDVVRSVMSTFWNLYFSAIQSCRGACQTVLQMPWQVQPTLLARLACRSRLACRDADEWWGTGRSLLLWEETMVTTCIAHGLPRLAVRALTLAVQLSRLQDYDDQSTVLQRALRRARDTSPPWSWNELIEALCAHRAESEQLLYVQWPSDADVAEWMTAFLSDEATHVIAPSPTFVSMLVRLAESIWPHLPESAQDNGTTEDRVARLCERLDLSKSGRRRLNRILIPPTRLEYERHSRG